MNFTLQPIKIFLITLVIVFGGRLSAQECEHLGLVSNGFLLGKFNCEVLIVSSDDGAIFQPTVLTDELTPGSVIRFSYEILDSTDCADEVSLINITCVTPFFETIDSILNTCNFDIESMSIVDSTSSNSFQLEVFNQTDFGDYHPQTVEWYEYETGNILGDTPIITYTSSENSPPIINICADITIALPEGNNCESTLCHVLIPDTSIPTLETCFAFFGYQPQDQLSSNGVINFHNLSFGNYEQVLWDFGDGQTDTTTASTFSHTYQSPGLYKVCLIVSDETQECLDTFCLSVFTVGGSEICNFNDCVLPGDANKDGLVNIFDALNLGIGFNQIGEVRPNADITPILQAAFDWDINTLLDLNFKHIDCDGNGEINELDFIAIENNYQYIEENDLLAPTVNSPEVSLHFSADTITVNPNQAKISIPAQLTVGTTNMPVNNFYGIALSLDYQSDFIADIEVNYLENPLMGIASNTFTRHKHLSVEKQLGIAITKNNQTPVSGVGDIAEVAFVIDHDLIEGRSTVFNVDIGGLVAIDGNGEEIPVSVPEDAPQVVIIFDENLTTNTEEQLLKIQFDIYPNPAKERLVIDLAEGLNLTNSNVEVFNSLGQKVIFQSLQSSQTTLDISALKTGVYWVKVFTKEGVGIREIVVE